MRASSFFWGVPLVLVACAVDGGTMPDRVGTSRQRIVGGTADKHDASVVMILQKSSPTANDLAFICTGSVVAPHVVLTAAHCLDPKRVGEGVFSVFLGNDIDDSSQFSDPKRQVAAKETHLHPKWVNTTVDTKYDVGVLVTTDELDVTPLPMNHDALGEDFVGTALRAVGAGQTSASDQNSSGHMFEMATSAKRVETEHLVFSEASKSLCHADSGGPTFAQRGGVEMIVGVHSGTAQDCTGENFDTRLDLYALSFVDPLIAKADPGFEPAGKPSGSDAGTTETADDAGGGAAEDGGTDSSPQPAADSGCAVRSTPASSGSTMVLGALAVAGAVLRRRRIRIGERTRSSR